MVAGIVSLLLLRHGQSEWNAVRRWQGLADSPLSELGRRQSADAGAALASSGHRFQSVWSSPLARAAETGDILADHLGLGAVRVDERLREADAGEWEGMTPDEINVEYPGFLADHRRPHSFERVEAVVERTTEALASIAGSSTHDDAAVIVTTHSGVIRTLVRHLGWNDERVPNLAGVWVSVDTSVTDVSARFDLRRRFDPAGVARTGVDTPGEDPGDQADETEAHRHTEG
jgi:broad specificity phosphatase PhoE